MDSIAFLNKVLPGPNLGNYVATVALHGKGDSQKPIMYNRGFDSIETLSSFCQTVSDRGSTAYFALGTFANNREVDEETGKTKWRRKAAMAQSFKTFAIDIDCGQGKPYADQREGIIALAAFLKASGLPRPMVVSSGYGLHCYWPIASEIDSLTWTTASDGLKALCARHELRIDESKVSDPAMVLRPIGTANHKREASVPVKLISDSPVFDNNSLIPLLTQVKGMPRAVKQTEKSVLVEALEAGEPTYEPAEPGKIVQRCAQIRRITFHKGANASEPEWYAALGIAAFCKDPEYVATEWSSGHSEYDPDNTLEKLSQWKGAAGPTRCSQFDKLNPGVCSECRYQGKIGSPIRLGSPDPKPIQQDDSLLTPHPFAEPPTPFHRTDRGISVDLDGVPLAVCAYDVFPSHIVYDPANGYEESVWYWNKPFKGYTKFKVRLSNVFNDAITELNNVLADNGILIETKQKQVYMGAYMRAYIQRLQKAFALSELPMQFGWRDNNKGFVIGSTEFDRKDDGTVEAREIGISRLIMEKRLDTFFTPKGDAAVWATWTKILNAPGMEAFQFALGVGFGSPLIEFSGLRGSIVSLVGKTGRGKSVIQNWVASIYGDPIGLAMKAEDTKAAIVQRLSMLGNLPVCIDECTNIDPAKMSDLTYWATQGQDRNRANEAMALQWSLIITLSSNKPIRDKQMSQSEETEALSMRLLEYSVPEETLFTSGSDIGRRVMDMLSSNYGVAGRIYIAHLLSLGADEIRRRLMAKFDELEYRYNANFAGKERYWAATIACVSLGIDLAEEAGVLRYNSYAGTKWAIDNLDGQRKYIDAVASTPYDMLASYINHNVGTALTVVFRSNGSVQTAEPIPRQEVFIRKEIVLDQQGKATSGVLYIDRRHLQKWMVGNGMDYKLVCDTFTSEAVEVKPNASGKISMGKNTPLRLGQVPVLALNLAHPKLEYMLDVQAHEELAAPNVVQLRR